ncbi:MAG: hypothetical protein RhofKO_42740 [Rhodothermales bacterium]
MRLPLFCLLLSSTLWGCDLFHEPESVDEKLTGIAFRLDGFAGLGATDTDQIILYVYPSVSGETFTKALSEAWGSNYDDDLILVDKPPLSEDFSWDFFFVNKHLLFLWQVEGIVGIGLSPDGAYAQIDLTESKYLFETEALLRAEDVPLSNVILRVTGFPVQERPL